VKVEAVNRRAQKLIEKFHDSSIYRMARGNAKDAPKQPLFHYTTEQALYSIIRSETFWFTSIYHMDDDAELLFGFGVSHALLSAAMERKDVQTNTFLRPLVEDYNFEKVKARFEFYSASFGQKDDAEQWSDYADGGAGVAMGLAPAFFELSNPKDPTPEEATFLGKIIYGETNAKIRHAGVIDSAISVVKQAYRAGLMLKAEDEDEFLRHVAAEMYVEILWNSVTSKAEKWSHQCETRLLAVNNRLNPKIKIHNAENRPRVELPQPLLKRNIAEVMLGPNADDSARLRVRTFLDENQLQHVPVTLAALRGSGVASSSSDKANAVTSTPQVEIGEPHENEQASTQTERAGKPSAPADTSILGK
jgi:Protein of unknown function (DUF2971)